MIRLSYLEWRAPKIKHPWSRGDQKTVRGTVYPRGGQVERTNRTIKQGEADQKTIRGIVFPLNVKRFHYDDHAQLRRHLADLMDTYNFGRPLKTLKGLTPYEFICKCWTSEPEKFILNPLHQMPGLNT